MGAAVCPDTEVWGFPGRSMWESIQRTGVCCRAWAVVWSVSPEGMAFREQNWYCLE